MMSQWHDGYAEFKLGLWKNLLRLINIWTMSCVSLLLICICSMLSFEDGTLGRMLRLYYVIEMQY